MNSVDKLREALGDCIIEAGHKDKFDTYWITKDAADKLIDEIEAEIAEHYLALPLDADGVPIRVGDELETAHGGKVIVEYIGECEVRVYRDGECYRISQDEYVYTCRHINHVKSRTIEDILASFLTAVGDDDPHYYDEQIAEYADEIRELLGGDAE